MILREKNIDVDVPAFERAMAEQKERSRANTKGTRTLWESQVQLPPTDDTTKYAPVDTMESKVLSILRDGEFVQSADAGDNVEVALDKTNFYGTQGGQVGDAGELVSDGKTVMTVTEADMNIDFILAERARELGGEWQRWLDLKRLGKLEERVKLYNPDAAPNFKPYHAYRPIPQSQFDGMPDWTTLGQNEGYGN